MAKASLIYYLAESAYTRDFGKLNHAINILIANERKDSDLQKRLKLLIESQQGKSVELPKEIQDFVMPTATPATLDDITFDAKAHDVATDFINGILQREALENLNLPAANKLLLYGPPGNGKTSLATAIAGALSLPLYVVDFANIIESFMGKTSTNLSKLFRGVAHHPCVLFLDEMETLLAERSGNEKRYDTQEAVRIVSTLLLEIDRLPRDVILIGATNHPDLLDKAVERRFDVALEIGQPTASGIIDFIGKLNERLPKVPVSLLAAEIDFDGKSYAAIENEIYALARKWALARKSA